MISHEFNNKRESNDSLSNKSMTYSPMIITDEEFRLLAGFVKNNYGINLRKEKKSLVVGRLQKELYKMNFNNFREYFNYISSDRTGKAVSKLINKITTNHTYFMREPEHFDFFRNHVLPYLKDTVNDRDLRIWSAGCSTGEEPYTLAMILDEFFGKEKIFWNTQVLATDISSDVLKKAKKGIYTNERIESIPYDIRMKYFKNIDNKNSQIIDRIKKEVVYARLNLMNKSFPFKEKFHTIFCRNVMIYFDNKTKMELVNKFYDMTEHGGYLFIGHSESLIRSETKYKYVMPSVYRKE